jgi:rhodanese-related sulfurtransferase
LAGYRVTDPVLLQLGRVIHDIEISPWAPDKNPHSADIEQAFRALQQYFDQRDVPVACYGRFFDVAYRLLSQSATSIDWGTLYALPETDQGCRNATTRRILRDDTPFVRQISIRDVLDYIGTDKRVIFVDAREGQEFDEFHIPGAINLTLREVDESAARRFSGADLVIGYCIKDFRGFEMARRLAEFGVKNTAIMIPYGLSGWRALKLPTAGLDGATEAQAIAELNECARGIRQCI